MALQGAAGVAMHLGLGRAGAGPRRAGHRASPVDRHVAARGAGPAGAGPLPGGRRRRARWPPSSRSTSTTSRSVRPAGRSCARWPATSTAALADAEEVERARSASYFDLALARLGGAIAADRAGDRIERRAVGGPAVGAVVDGRRRRVHRHRPGPPRRPTPGGPRRARQRATRRRLASHRRRGRRRLGLRERSDAQEADLGGIVPKGRDDGRPDGGTRPGWVARLALRCAQAGSTAPPRVRVPARARRRARRSPSRSCCCSTPGSAG